MPVQRITGVSDGVPVVANLAWADHATETSVVLSADGITFYCVIPAFAAGSVYDPDSELALIYRKMYLWCSDVFGLQDVHRRWYVDELKFCFRSESDCAAFVLRWS
jgi:hypothetical protein